MHATELWAQTRSLAPPEVWAALGGFMLSTLLHWLARWAKVNQHLLLTVHAPMQQNS